MTQDDVGHVVGDGADDVEPVEERLDDRPYLRLPEVEGGDQ